MKLSSGHRVLVTGGASGLGLALVTQLAARGCTVLATDVHAEAPEVASIDGVTYRTLDVTSDVDWHSARDWVLEEWGGLDALFNNAGVAAGGRIELTEMDQWQWIVDINLLGVVRGCRTFVPMMKQQAATAGAPGLGAPPSAKRSGVLGGGRQTVAHLVNTSSAAGLIHPPRMSEYNAVKAGVVALSETLFHELKPFGVQVSVICPTFFKTNLTSSLRGKDESAQGSAAKLIDGSTRTADDIATVVLKEVDKGTHVILTDREGRLAYAAKRFLRPLYYREMAKAAVRMGRKD